MTEYVRIVSAVHAAGAEAQRKGAVVTHSRAPDDTSSRLRMESDAFVAELVVRSFGRVDVSLANVATGAFVCDKSMSFGDPLDPLVTVLEAFGVSWNAD